MTNKDLTEKHHLDRTEQEIEDSLEREEWNQVSPDNELLHSLTKAAHRKKIAESKKITVRINQTDLSKLKAKAHKKNIPYQTLLGVLVRDFVDGDYEIRL